MIKKQKITKNPLSSRRNRARRAALQALYQWQISGQSMNEVESFFLANTNFKRIDVDFFSALLYGINDRLLDLIKIIETHSDRSIDLVTPIERNALLIGIYELSERIDVPYRVVISEAVSLAQKFGTGDGCRFVNGVLDKIATRFRASEIAAEKNHERV